MFRKRIFEIVTIAKDGDRASKVCDDVLLITIIVNTIAVFVATINNISMWIAAALIVIEIVSTMIFTAEYLMRLATCDIALDEANKAKAVLKFVFSFIAICDLLSIMPFYIALFGYANLQAFRLFKLFRLIRLLKINKYTNALDKIVDVLRNKSNELISSIIILGMLMLISSLLMYYLETDAQPDVFTSAFSGIWWSVATFTTVGYGDIYPITIGGKIVSSIIAFLGIGLVAVPTGIITSGFFEKLSGKNGEIAETENAETEAQHLTKCPHCGKDLPH